MIDIVEKILKVFNDNHLWDEGVELIGSWCFILYQKHFEVKPFPFRTLDIDFLIPFPYKGKEKIDLVGLLEPLGFKVSFNSNGSIYLWNPEIKIEFITIEKGRGSEKAKEIKQLSIKAIPLRFVDILLEDPVEVQEKGVKVLIPKPGAFALHKLLISGRRKKRDKKAKDLQQALHVLEAIDIKEVIKIYKTFPVSWQKLILDALEKASGEFLLMEDFIGELMITLRSA